MGRKLELDMDTTMLTTLILVIFTLGLFITEVFPLSISGIFGMLLLILTKTLTFNEAFSQISGSIVGIAFGMMIVGSGMSQSGLIDAIGQMLVKLARGNAKTLLWILVWFCFIAAAFLSNTTVVVLGFTLATGVVKANSNMKLRNFAMPVAFATCFGGQCTLIGTTSNLVGSGVLEKYTGSPLGMWTQTPVGLIVGGICCLVMCLIAFPLGNRIWEDRPEASFIIKDTSLKTDKRKMWIMAVIIIALIICWVFEFLPVAEGALLAACLVIMFQIIDIKSAFADVDWNICIWLGIILALPTAISKSGLSGWLADNVLSRANMGGSPWMAFAFIITFAWVLTHFISNSTCIAIVLPIALEMCKVTGTNPLTYTIGISITSALAIATPLGAGFVAYVAMAGYNFRDFLRFGLPFAVLSLILVIVVTPLIFPFHV